MKYLIIGNGIAGISAAEAIRELDESGDITMVSDETALPYSRPMITHLLEGSCKPEQLPIRPSNFYDRLGITPILGHRVESMDVDRKTVTISNDQTLAYDRVLIASGADPRPIKAEGMHLKNIFYMRTADHAKKQLAALPHVRRAVVLGGGLVGFKSAYALMKQGVQVTLLITSGYPLSMQVDAVAGKMLLREMMAKGLHIKVGAKVVSFHGAINSDNVTAVQLDTRLTLPCEMVIIGKGVLPALSFVPRHRIATDLGIYVNNGMETSFPGIYAAGDVAECMDIARESFWVNAIWPEAAIQGRIAGQNMAGKRVSHPGSLSRNVMRVFDMDVMTMGMADARSTKQKDLVSIRTPLPSDFKLKSSFAATVSGPSSTLKRSVPSQYSASCPSNFQYRNIIFRENVPVGAVLINNIEQGGVIRSLIEQKRPIEEPLERLTSPHFNFAKLLTLLLICFVCMLSTPESSPAQTYDVGPVIGIDVANAPSPVMQNSSISLTLRIRPEDYTGVKGDWWIIHVSPSEIRYFDLATMAFQPGLQMSFQGGLFDFEGVQLPALLHEVGDHVFYFGVDTLADGILNISTDGESGVDTGRLFFEFSSITVKEEEKPDPPDPVTGSGFITYMLDGNAYRIEAKSSASPENLSHRLDALSPGSDFLVNASPNGEWLIFSSERHPDCMGWACLMLADGDLTGLTPVMADGNVVHEEGTSAVDSTGTKIVFSMEGEAHTRDLFMVEKRSGTWGAPSVLTSQSPFAYNNTPAFSDDGSRIVFECGDEPYVNKSICQVNVSGTAFQTLFSPDHRFTAARTPDYAPDGSIVTELDSVENGESIYRMSLDTGSITPVNLSFSNDNSPCVLSDGRIASLWLNREGGEGLHELKIMNSDGSGDFMLLMDIDILDAVLGCNK